MRNVSLRTNYFRASSEKAWKLAKLISGPGRSEPERTRASASGSAERLPEVLRPSGLGFGPGWLRLRICKPSSAKQMAGNSRTTREDSRTTREDGRSRTGRPRKARQKPKYAGGATDAGLGRVYFRHASVSSRGARQRASQRPCLHSINEMHSAKNFPQVS